MKADHGSSRGDRALNGQGAESLLGVASSAPDELDAVFEKAWFDATNASDAELDRMLSELQTERRRALAAKSPRRRVFSFAATPLRWAATARTALVALAESAVNEAGKLWRSPTSWVAFASIISVAVLLNYSGLLDRSPLWGGAVDKGQSSAGRTEAAQLPAEVLVATRTGNVSLSSPVALAIVPVKYEGIGRGMHRPVDVEGPDAEQLQAAQSKLRNSLYAAILNVYAECAKKGGDECAAPIKASSAMTPMTPSDSARLRSAVVTLAAQIVERDRAFAEATETLQALNSIRARAAVCGTPPTNEGTMTCYPVSTSWTGDARISVGSGMSLEYSVLGVGNHSSALMVASFDLPSQRDTLPNPLNKASGEKPN